MQSAPSHRVSRQLLCAALVCALVQAPVSSLAQQRDEQLELGVKQVEGGEFDAAVITLDGVVRRLSAGGASSKELARAYTYLGITYLSLGQETSAKARFLEALKVEPGLKLDAKEFPPKVVQFFDQVKAQAPAPAAAAAAPTPAPARAPDKAAAPPATTTTPPVAAPEKKGGGSKVLFIVLGVGAAAGIAAVAAGGGGGGSSTTQPPATTVPPATAADLSATTSSPQSNVSINCTNSLHVTVTLTNRARSPITITGVRREPSAISGGCTPGGGFTYTPNVTSVAANSSSAVFNGEMLTNGVGCCQGSCNGGSCQFRQDLTVITPVGSISAGHVNYSVRFRDCVQCSSIGAAALECARTP